MDHDHGEWRLVDLPGVDIDIWMTKKTLDNEDMTTFCSDVERSSSMFPLDVDLDVVPLEKLRHHHPQPLVGRHTQRGLPVLVELVGVLAYRLQLVDHVSVPGEERDGVIEDSSVIRDSPLRIVLLLENCLNGRMEHYAEVFRFRRF